MAIPRRRLKKKCSRGRPLLKFFWKLGVLGRVFAYGFFFFSFFDFVAHAARDEPGNQVAVGFAHGQSQVVDHELVFFETRSELVGHDFHGGIGPVFDSFWHCFSHVVSLFLCIHFHAFDPSVWKTADDDEGQDFFIEFIDRYVVH